MYKDKHFRIRPVAEIRQDFLSTREYYGSDVHSQFLPDGNTILMKTSELVEILQYAQDLFPALSRITMYGSPRVLNLKTPGGEFQLLSPHQSLAEIKLLLETLSVPGADLYSDYFSNYAWVNGRMPRDSARMIRVIDELLPLPESECRPTAEGGL